MKNITFKSYQHNPPHIYADNACYMVTAGTYDKIRYFNNNSKKELLFKIIKEFINQYKYELLGWVILDNHYHILIKSKYGKDLPKIFRKIHSKSAMLVCKDAKKLRKTRIWYNYWDTCIRDEKDYYTRLNYIHSNPIKHRYVGCLEDYKFSSFDYYIKVKGREWICDILEKYPIIDFIDDKDRF